MHPVVRITCVIAAALGAAVTPAAGQEVAGPAPAARLTSCLKGPTPPDRVATFAGSMAAVEGTDQMRMRFVLQERRPGSDGFRRIQVPKFGTWQRSRRGVPAFSFTKRVDGLGAPAAYRVVVSFRWYDAAGRLVREARRRSAICRQPDPRPDLALGALTVAPVADAALRRYVVTVRNDGRGDAAIPFGVQLTVAGESQPIQTIAALGAGGAAKVSFEAPLCAPGSRLRLAVDPGDAVDESDEADNLATRACPSSAR